MHALALTTMTHIIHSALFITAEYDVAFMAVGVGSTSTNAELVVLKSEYASGETASSEYSISSFEVR